MNTAEYIEQCKLLSIDANVAIGLLIFEKFCIEKKIEHPQIDELKQHLWFYIEKMNSFKFADWEKNKPVLVDRALERETTKQLLPKLQSAGVTENTFIRLTSSLVFMLWSNFWQAADLDFTHECLQEIITVSDLSEYPPLTPFKLSPATVDGWGERLSAEDYTFWRTFWCKVLN